MQKASDYALVKTASVKGKVNTETENFEVSYKDITAKKGAMDGIRKAALSVNLLSKTSVKISADVITAERKPLFVRYNGACAKALADLSNQVELNQETTTTIAALQRGDTTLMADQYIACMSRAMSANLRTPHLY